MKKVGLVMGKHGTLINGKKFIMLLLLFFVMILAGCNNDEISDKSEDVYGKIIAPPRGGVYLGAYNWSNTGVSSFEEVTGRKLAIGNPYPFKDGGTENTWPAFDAEGHEKNWVAGYITWTGFETGLGENNAKFIPQDVIDGKIDTYLKTDYMKSSTK